MEDRTYEDGYRDGWESVAAEEAMPEPITYPPEGEPRDYHSGFLCGKAEAALHYKPGSARHPPEPTGL